MSEVDVDRRLQFALGIAVVFVLLYSFLVTRRLLFGANLVAWLLGIYLFWRFVRAVERIAAALEN